MDYANEFKLLDKEYYNHAYGFEVGYNTDEASFVKFSHDFGKNFDKDFRLFELATRFQLFKKLSLNYEFTHIKFTPDPEFESTTINVIGLDYFFTKDLWVRIFTQNNSRSDKFYLYGLLGWRFKPPFGAAYVIVNTDQYQYPVNGLPSSENFQSEIVFVKLTYPISVIKN
jgi:hypothetical protein